MTDCLKNKWLSPFPLLRRIIRVANYKRGFDLEIIRNAQYLAHLVPGHFLEPLRHDFHAEKEKAETPKCLKYNELHRRLISLPPESGRREEFEEFEEQ